MAGRDYMRERLLPFDDHDWLPHLLPRLHLIDVCEVLTVRLLLLFGDIHHTKRAEKQFPLHKY